MAMRNRLFFLTFAVLLSAATWADYDFVTGLELPADSLVDSEGDEMGQLDDINPDSMYLLDCQSPYFFHDTLVLDCAGDVLPGRLNVRTSTGVYQYRLLPQFMLGDSALLNHPADSIYHHIWASDHVNPYGTMFDTIKTDVHIDLAGFCLPHNGYITSHYGWRRYRMHKGTDIKVQVGDTIRASWPGQVRIVGWDPRGYGYYVVIRHDNGFETVYGHLSRPMCDEYERVYAGDLIGLGGNTGRSTGSHLHYEIRYLGHALNPEQIIDFANGKLVNDSVYTISAKQVKQQVAEAQATRYHTVRQGDTLSGIAKKYRTKVSTLCKLNRISENSILRIGQKIRVS